MNTLLETVSRATLATVSIYEPPFIIVAYGSSNMMGYHPEPPKYELLPWSTWYEMPFDTPSFHFDFDYKPYYCGASNMLGALPSPKSVWEDYIKEDGFTLRKPTVPEYHGRGFIWPMRFRGMLGNT